MFRTRVQFSLFSFLCCEQGLIHTANADNRRVSSNSVANNSVPDGTEVGQKVSVCVPYDCGRYECLYFCCFVFCYLDFTSLYLPSSLKYKCSVYNVQLTTVWESAARHAVH